MLKYYTLLRNWTLVFTEEERRLFVVEVWNLKPISKWCTNILHTNVCNWWTIKQKKKKTKQQCDWIEKILTRFRPGFHICIQMWYQTNSLVFRGSRLKTTSMIKGVHVSFINIQMMHKSYNYWNRKKAQHTAVNEGSLSNW